VVESFGINLERLKTEMLKLVLTDDFGGAGGVFAFRLGGGVCVVAEE